MTTPQAVTDEAIAAEAETDALEAVAVLDQVPLIAVSQVYNP